MKYIKKYRLKKVSNINNVQEYLESKSKMYYKSKTLIRYEIDNVTTHRSPMSLTHLNV